MNILNEIGKEQIRTDLPQVNIGDTVHVYIKVKEGTRERIQMLKVLLLRRSMAVLLKLSQYAEYHTALALKRLSSLTHLTLTVSISFVRVKFVVLNSTISVIEWVRLRRLKKDFNTKLNWRNCILMQYAFLI